MPQELLDALERDFTMEVPRRRVKRAFNNDDRTPIVSTSRFHVFSSEDEHKHTISSDDVDRHESVTQPPSGLLATWVDEPLADRTGMHTVSDDEGSLSMAAVPASQVGRDCGVWLWLNRLCLTLATSIIISLLTT